MAPMSYYNDQDGKVSKRHLYQGGNHNCLIVLNAHSTGGMVSGTRNLVKNPGLVRSWNFEENLPLPLY